MESWRSAWNQARQFRQEVLQARYIKTRRCRRSFTMAGMDQRNGLDSQVKAWDT